ncbi:MAG: hypothetical protein FWC19_06495 [Treponema sp.]|nr:hypothetical protein [Treponema sp.]MCL2272433.1 hypothetical protein [Treponema sp.]
MESGFINLLQSWGPTAASSLLIFIVSFLIRKINAISDKDEARTAKLHNDIQKIHADVNHTLNSFGERLTRVENDSVKSEFFYREMQGWRSEINRVSDQITNCFTTLTQNIFQLLNRGEK